jgi:hypothetical protein
MKYYMRWRRDREGYGSERKDSEIQGPVWGVWGGPRHWWCQCVSSGVIAVIQGRTCLRGCAGGGLINNQAGATVQVGTVQSQIQAPFPGGPLAEQLLDRKFNTRKVIIPVVIDCHSDAATEIQSRPVQIRCQMPIFDGSVRHTTTRADSALPKKHCPSHIELSNPPLPHPHNMHKRCIASRLWPLKHSRLWNIIHRCIPPWPIAPRRLPTPPVHRVTLSLAMLALACDGWPELAAAPDGESSSTF